MPSVNIVVLMGNLTRDVDLTVIQSTQMAVARFGMAMNKKFKTKEGEQKESVTFVDCEAWGKTAESIARYFSKGKLIFIEGELKLDQWQDKDGSKRSKLKIVVQRFEFVERKADAGDDRDRDPDHADHMDAEAAESPRPSKTSSREAGPRYPPAHHEPIGADDIPF